MLTKKKYNRLSIHEKINYRASLKRKKDANVVIAEAISFVLEFGLAFVNKHVIEKEKKKSIYTSLK